MKSGRANLTLCCLTLAAGLVLACQAPQDGGEAVEAVRLSGTVRTAVGEVPVLAHVHLVDVLVGETLRSVEAGPDGAFELAVPRAGNDRLVNGTRSDSLEYDGGGDYYSIVAVEDGRAEIAFDPAALPPASEEVRPAVDTSSVSIARAFELNREAEVAAAELRRETQERGEALVKLIFKAKQDGDQERWQELHAELVDEFGEDRRFRVYVKTLNPRKRMAVGKTLPEFELVLLGGARTVSDQSLRGSYLLIDFWATWCVPCVAELPQLHKVWEKWGGERFQILSLSFDENAEVIQPFRDEKWAMPWLHAFVEEGMDSELAKELEVFGIPYPVLVDPEGKIVATDEKLRGDAILDTLAEHLGNDASG